MTETRNAHDKVVGHLVRNMPQHIVVANHLCASIVTEFSLVKSGK